MMATAFAIFRRLCRSPKVCKCDSHMSWRVGVRRGSSAWARTQTPTTLCEPGILTGSLRLIRHHSSGRRSQFQLGAHLLNLRGLVFYCCYETRNRAFQFRDPLLLFLEFIDFHLRLGALVTAYSHLLLTGIDRSR